MGYYASPEEDPLFPKNLPPFDQNAAGPRFGANNHQVSYRYPHWFGTEGVAGNWYPHQPLHTDMYPPSFFQDRSFLQSPRFNLSADELNEILKNVSKSGLTEDINNARSERLWNPREPMLNKEKFSDIVREYMERYKNMSPEEIQMENRLDPALREKFFGPVVDQPTNGATAKPKGLPGDASLGKYGADYDLGNATGRASVRLGPVSFSETILKGLEHPAVQVAAVVPDAYRRGSAYNEYADRSTPGGASYGTKVMNNLYGFGDAFNDTVSFGLYDYVKQGPEASPRLKSIRDSFESAVMRILSDAETKETPSSSRMY